MTLSHHVTTVSLFLAAVTGVAAENGENPLTKWRTDVQIRPVLGADAAVHSIHTYYTTAPESPDGSRVLFFRSNTEDAHVGEICVLDRNSGELQVLASDIETEDAHRAACQQWILGGDMVVFHEYREGQWQVVTVHLRSGEKRVYGPGLQVGFCQPDSDIVPLYGPHGAPGDHPNVELLNVQTGEINSAAMAESVPPVWANAGAAGEYLDRQFAGKPISICFPMISPDGKRVFFKLATAGLSHDFRSHAYSNRKGVFLYDLIRRDYLYFHVKWGHPAWHPDSRRIINMWNGGPVMINIEKPQVEQRISMPDFMMSGGHPSMSPDENLFVTDGQIIGKEGWWGVALGDFQSGEWHLLKEFDNSKGAESSRKSHPHPVFSRDAQRVYFNVSSGAWTRLYVAELR